ncbi:hypothetical protein CVM73_16035 [Bradyrhizobium forestalis]|uniref:Uncharacterized protein n=1 Tax=Bradyrhizobium forestalis TaxID=1419263 RepID=A0A2M8R921_9BRAD|nr:hypothetical protein CVM73_16035 [Bradyrhizobium forestalis]
MVCQKQGAAPCVRRQGGNEKSFVRQEDCADEAGCLSRGRENASAASFEQEADGPAQSFRDQD